MPISALADHELVMAYLKGSEDSFAILLERHKNRVYSQILSMVHDREIADDIFQETFFKVIHTLKSGKYKDEGKFIHWVLRIAHNLTIDLFRAQKRMPMQRSDDQYDVFGFLPNDEPNREQVLVKDQILKDVQRLMHELPEEQKEVVHLRLYEGKSYKEIADMKQISINTALGRMRYALINIRKIAERHGTILTE